MDAGLLLSSAGWFPGRVIDVSRTEHAYESEGFTMHDAGLAVLQEFSELVVCGDDRRQCLWFDGERALRGRDSAWSHAYSEDSGRVLLPVGEYSHMVVLVDEAGGLWGGFDDSYGWLAGSVVELVHGLFIDPAQRSFDRQLPDER
ncbi:SUKH-3 immunity protein of toxin-antitoxin system [Kribbella steppae]|uniref:SUKH-3 immunity protein of toxin-antitoxin system n=1 Tax=Kribbella steppae TaxID=2512223 RepID=A0A4R2H3K1_9ACTN|nr:SUKH-3 domain-containing protein [Kribbella steppae]TCO19084.1 SUKH-3 immunity protein of toxin-antitoxin system [Kribbella steppae]